MFNPLGAVSALGSGAMEGMGQGMALQQQYEQIQGQQLLMGALKGVNGMSPAFSAPAGGSGPAPPQQGAMPPPQAAPGPPMPPPGPVQTPPPMSGGQGANISPVSMAQAGPMSGGAGPGGPGGPGPAVPGLMNPQMMARPGGPQVAPGMVPPTGSFQPQSRPQAPPQQQGTPEQQQIVQAGQGTPHEVEQLRTKGIGWMTPQELATRIELTNPNASPGAKFHALKQGMQLLNQSGQMQMLQLMQSREFHEDTMRERRLSDDRADARLRLQMSREERLSPEGVAATQQAKQQVSALIGPAREALKQSTVQFNAVETKEKSLMTQMDVLGKISGKLSITGFKPFDTWVAEMRVKAGDPEATKYEAQLKTVQRDAALALSPTVSGHMTDSARTEVQSFISGLMSPKTIGALKELFRQDAELNKQVYKGQIKQWQDAIKAGGTLPEEPATAAPTQAPAVGGGSAGWGKAQVVQ